MGGGSTLDGPRRAAGRRRAARVAPSAGEVREKHLVTVLRGPRHVPWSAPSTRQSGQRFLLEPRRLVGRRGRDRK